MVHLYHNVLLPILPSDDILYDFPVSVSFTYFSSQHTRRQRIYFSKLNSFLALYNHSDFLKIHMHNAWLLGKTDITMNVPADYFISPKHLFIFCGSLNIYKLCDLHDVNTFLFVASYLIINDSFLFNLLKTFGSVNYKDNDMLLPTLYSLLPRTLSWFESKFPHYNTTFVSFITHLPFGAFRRKFLNYECHNERYEIHFYNSFIDC